MNQRIQLLQQYQQEFSVNTDQYRKHVLSRLTFRLFLFMKLPMAFLAGIRVRELTTQSCSVTVPYKWLNQNPFRSTYFAVSAMAGEMCGGLLALMMCNRAKPSVATLVVKVEASFSKKATGLTTFVCSDGEKIRQAIEQSILSGEGSTAQTTSIGYNVAGEEESRFIVTWSFKVRQ